jgi:hypothetical protein
MTAPQNDPPVSMKRPIVGRGQKPPSGKVVVPVALLVCGGLAFALFAASGRPRPAVVQPVDSASTLQAPDSSQRDAGSGQRPKP